jgi:hypothetical protein
MLFVCEGTFARQMKGPDPDVRSLRLMIRFRTQHLVCA